MFGKGYYHHQDGRLVTCLQTNNTRDNVNFEIASETGSVLCQMALWDWFVDKLGPSILRNLIIANKRNDGVINNPIMQFYTTPTRSSAHV